MSFLAPGQVKATREHLGQRFITHVKAEMDQGETDMEVVYHWAEWKHGPAQAFRGLVIGRFYINAIQASVQRVLRVKMPAYGMPMHEMTDALAALAEEIGPIPADVWSSMHGTWLRTASGLAILVGNVNPAEQERIHAVDWINHLNLRGNDAMVWHNAKTGDLIDPNVVDR